MTDCTSQAEIETEILDAMQDTGRAARALFDILIDLEKSGDPLVAPQAWRRAIEAQREIESAFLVLLDRAQQQYRRTLQ